MSREFREEMDALSSINILGLAELLKPPGEDSDSDEDMPKSGLARMGPADVGSRKKSDKISGSSKPALKTIKKDTKDIWDGDEVAEGAEYDDSLDPRPQPEYEILYRQAVTSEDLYLQMGNKTPTTASCEDMIVKIKLPNCKLSEVELDVKETFLDCRTPKHKLGLFLPHPVDPKLAKAQWDGDHEILNVTLRLNRAYDFINF